MLQAMTSPAAVLHAVLQHWLSVGTPLRLLPLRRLALVPRQPSALE
jgi:hypothetical protein